MKKYYLIILFLISSFAGFTQIRIVSVNPGSNEFVLKNFGSSTVDISTNRICTEITYATINTLTVLSGSTNLVPGASVTLTGHSIDPGGNGADLGYYAPTGAFSSTVAMLDFMQFGSAGNGRESVAASKGIWNAGDFAATASTYYFNGSGTQFGILNWRQSTCDDIFFSEYIEGSSNNKAIEIFNPTSSAIDLSDYFILQNSNGGPFDEFIDRMDGMLQPQDVYVIANGSADPVIQAVKDTTMTGVCFFNGDDARVIAKWVTDGSANDTIMFDVTGDLIDDPVPVRFIDVLGDTVDPGSQWNANSLLGTSGVTKEQTIIREGHVSMGNLGHWDMGSAPEWDAYPQNTFSFLGSHSSFACPSVGGVTDCGDLFISEYIEGSSSNKAIELANPNSSLIDLSDYTIYRANNGSLTYQDSIELSGFLAPNQVYKIVNPSADTILLNQADTTHSITFYNGDDVLHLVNTSTNTVVDVFGELGVDPGSGWTINGVNGVIGATNNYTLVRAPFVQQGNALWSVVENQWYVFPINEFGFYGSHHSQICGSSVPAYMIGDVLGNDASGVPDSIGVECQLTGIIHNPDQGFFDVEFAFQDVTAGIWLEGNPLPTYSPIAEGDLITVWGTIGQDDGLTYIIPDSMLVNSTGNPLYPAEKMDTLNEYTEGRYVRLDSVKFLGITPGDTFAITGGGNTYTIVTQQLDTFDLEVEREYENDWNGFLIPTGIFDVVGIGSQEDFSGAPLDGGYKILPSRYSDLNIHVVAGEAISFGSPSDGISESGGSYLVLVTVADTVGTISTVDVNHTGGTAAAGTDFSFNDTTLTFSAGAIDSFWLPVTIIDNALPNADRTVVLSLQNLTGSALYGADTVFTLTIFNDDIPTYSIGTIRGNNTNGIADSIGVYCKATGVVIGVDLQGSSSNAFSFDDGTGGISVFMGGGFTPPYVVTEGDSIRMIGVIAHFNGLSQFTPDSMVLISSGATVPTPTVVTALGENTESRYIRINNVTLVDPAEWMTGNSFTARIMNATDTFDLRADSDVNVSNMLPPVGAFDVIGVGGQFDGAGPPWNTGYQILPMDTSQIIPFVAPTPSIPTYNIGDVIGLDASFVPDSLGVACKLVGVVYGENFRLPGGLSFTLIDPNNDNDGIAVFNSSANVGYTVVEGDEIRVIGSIAFFSGLTEIVPDSIVVISNGNTIKNPVVVSTLNEFSESNLVVREGNYLSEGVWGTGTSGFNARFVDLLTSIDTFEVRIDNDCDLFTAAEPLDGMPYNIVGIGGQFDFSSPYDQGYQLFPRRSSDLNLITGLTGNLKANEVKIYPVPSSGLIHIESATQGTQFVKVMDILGNVKFQTILEPGISEMNLEFLSQGNYLVKIQEGSNVVTRKITLIK